MAVIGRVLIDGESFDAESAAISVLDVGFQRGYGCFEAVRAYDGRLFRLDAHLARLEQSAAKLHLPVPDRTELVTWCTTVAEAAGDSVIRTLVSGGTDPRNLGTNSRTIVIAEAVPPQPSMLSLQSRIAPWHSDGDWFELTGAKALSYGFNLAASVEARSAGYDDALLIGRSGNVLEGPTFSVAWITDGTFHTPSLEMGILESITRRASIEVAQRVGVPVVEGVYGLDDVFKAAEVVALSTVKEVHPVGRIDDRQFVPGQVTAALAAGFSALVAEELDR
ncbi:MAG: branched-chain-amino-acid transaminase [Acidimicrobiia bacterium]|nr:MAG: branched-chain-amino-acid transaminase [Acidimicrobiia bacterium]